jgi:hypothetical protein
MSRLAIEIVGQTGRTFKIRYKEHIQAIRNNSSNSGYLSHILNTGHTYGTVTDTMDYMNTLEKYHIYKVSKTNIHLKDTQSNIPRDTRYIR